VQKAANEAEAYLRRVLETQSRLGYSRDVDARVYDQALAEATRAVQRLMRAARLTTR
jgi:hypothetical protein